MLHLTKLMTLVVSIALAPVVCDAQPLKNKDAMCSVTVGGRCEVQFNVANGGKAYYRIQRLDELSGAWVTLGGQDEPWQKGGTVEVGSLYRVLGCNDIAGTRGCLPSHVFWAPIIVPGADIPSRVRLADGNGGEEWAAISTGAPVVERLRQLNVYKISDVLTRTSGLIDTRMTSPAEHSHEAGFPHDENMIHHDVFQQFNALQMHFVRRAD